MCHSTAPPTPRSVCARPSSANALSSPTFHLALLTNWKTATLIPAFQARIAIPNAAVDLPLPAPVCTASTGWVRRERVVNPSSGTIAG